MATTSVHVAVFPFPFSSHTGVLFNLTKRLAKSAPNVEFTFFSTQKSNDAIFNSKSADIPSNIKPFNVWDGVPADSESRSKAKGPFNGEIEFYMETAPETLRKAVKESGKKMSCMMSDPFLWFVVEIAEEMNLPWIAAYASGVHSLATHVYTDIIRQKFTTTNDNDDVSLLSFIPDFNSDFYPTDLPSGIISGDLDSVIANLLHKMGRVLPRATSVLANCVEELHPQLTTHFKSKFNQFLCIGPFNLTIPKPRPSPDPYNCIPFLNNQPPNSVIYISFGTVVRPPTHEITAIATAIHESGYRYLWSMKQEQIESDLPTSFLKWGKDSGHGMVVPWAPQLDVLEHRSVGVFVTHFGWNSVMESIASGVPMIGRPFFGDHPLNARLAETKWGVGVPAGDTNGGLSKEGIKKALNRVMKEDGDERKRMVVNAAKLKDVLTVAAASGGSSSVNFDTLVEFISHGY